MQEIAEWLASIGLGEYTKVFAENAVDFSVLNELTDQDFKELGVKLGHRHKLRRAISELHSTPGVPVKTPKLLPRQAERRQLTVIFCDLVGSTELTARLDPEDMMQIMASYHACIQEILGRYGGKVARYMGDGLMAYFGYPQAREDDAVQAVRAALALAEAVPNLQTHVGATLQVRLGVATGTVVVRELFIEENPAEEAAIGDTPNLAARLQALADPGMVLICQNTRRLTGGHFNYREVAPVALKGFREPVPSWQVMGASGVASHFEAMHESKLPPLFGREEEVELVLRRWRHASDGEGRVVLLTGEPGIGKSHISLAIEEHLKNEPHSTARYFCSAHHTTSALLPFMGQLERAASFQRSDSPAQKVAKLDALVSQSTADPEHLAVLAHLFALPTGDHEKLEQLSPQKRKEKTFAALLAQIGGLAARQPLYMIFEDVHWIDPTSLELLAAIVEKLPRLRALLLVTTRPEFTPPWPSYAHMTTIPLTRLGRRDGEALVARVAGHKKLPKEVVDEILGRTDGVPMFIEELTKTVLESELLRERHSEYVIEHPVSALAIARLADGAARSAVTGAGGGTDRRRRWPGVSLRAAQRRCRIAGEQTGRGP
jgi:class 3 adenylate cyclase